MKADSGSLTAVILCGGKGERLRPFTDKFPKPLVPLLDKPLLLIWLSSSSSRESGNLYFALATKPR